jgi:hypothetical protein
MKASFSKKNLSTMLPEKSRTLKAFIQIISAKIGLISGVFEWAKRTLALL